MLRAWEAGKVAAGGWLSRVAGRVGSLRGCAARYCKREGTLCSFGCVDGSGEEGSAVIGGSRGGGRGGCYYANKRADIVNQVFQLLADLFNINFVVVGGHIWVLALGCGSWATGFGRRSGAA